jgi:hypothetical protein
MKIITLFQSCVDKDGYIDIAFAYLEYTIPLCLVCFLLWAIAFWKKSPGSKVRVVFFFSNLFVNLFLKLLISSQRPGSACGFGPSMPSFRAQIGAFFFLHVCMLNGWSKRLTSLCSSAFAVGLLGSILTRSVGASDVVVGVAIGGAFYLVSIAAHYGKFDPFIRRIDYISMGAVLRPSEDSPKELAFEAPLPAGYHRDVNA